MKTLATLIAAGALAVIGTAFADHPRLRYLHMHDDVNKDFRGDIFFRVGTALAYTTADSGPPMASSGVYAGDGGPGYSVAAVSDFDGDRSADVLWSNGSHLKLWINDGAGSYTTMSVGNYGGGWEPFAAGDINGDGRSDLFFRASTHLAYWLMDGQRVIASSYAGDGGAGYRVVAIADFTGEDHSPSVDVLWTNGSQLKTWVSDAGRVTFQPYSVGSYGGGWEPFAAGDVNGDQIADILFRGATHIAYWRLQTFEVFSGFSYVSRYAGDGGTGFRAIAVSEYSVKDDGGVEDVLWTNGSQLKLWEGDCYGCVEPVYLPVHLGSYGGGWQPLEMLLTPGLPAG